MENKKNQYERTVVEREAELQFLAQTAKNIGDSYRALPPENVTGFLAMQGQYYNGDLMVAGRAVNGWTKKTWPPKVLAEDVDRDEFVHYVLKSVEAPDSCPMQWVSQAWGNRSLKRPSNWTYVQNQDYNTLRSAFWRVIRSVVGELRIADITNESWPSYLVWSNLYKISPAVGRNPSAKMRSLQRDSCISLFQTETLSFKPRRLLFLTGHDWAAPFLKRVEAEIFYTRGSYVESVGTFNSGNDKPCLFVVASHPERKPEAPWVNEVIKAFARLSSN